MLGKYDPYKLTKTTVLQYKIMFKIGGKPCLYFYRN